MRALRNTALILLLLLFMSCTYYLDHVRFVL